MTLGHEVAGVVAKPGAGVSSIRVGDKAVTAQVVQPVGQADWPKSHWDRVWWGLCGVRSCISRMRRPDPGWCFSCAGGPWLWIRSRRPITL